MPPQHKPYINDDPHTKIQKSLKTANIQVK